MLADPRGSGVCDELLRKQREWIERGTRLETESTSIIIAAGSNAIVTGFF